MAPPTAVHTLAAMTRQAAGVQAPKRRSQGTTAPPAPRRPAWLTPTRTLLLGLAAAVVIAGVLIGVSVGGSGTSSNPQPTNVVGGAAVNALLAGIPQSGNVLGDPQAPATLVEFAEPQCPVCAAWAVQTLPTVVRNYVRPGKLKIVFHGISFIRPTSDSENALRALAAAGKQGRTFQLLDLLYHNQGQEGSGWVTDDLLRALGGAVRGLDVPRMMAERSAASSTAVLDQSARAATKAMGGNLSTPTFLAGPSGGTLTEFQISTGDQLAPAGFSRLLDQLTAQ